MCRAKAPTRLPNPSPIVQIAGMKSPPQPRCRTALALQGGGSHGAYAWGVLDELLAAGETFDAVCGVSSGAILGTMAVQGLVRGGADGARAAMAEFWDRVVATNVLAPLTSHLDRWLPGFEAGREFGSTLAMQGIATVLSLFGHASINPLGQNPLRPILADLLDRAALADPAAPRLFIAATAVESGQPRIFTNREITVDALLASACLPTLFPTVLIDGVAYWDGAYSGNPPLGPLLALDPERLVLIRAQSRLRAGVPGQPADILNRVQELAFQTAIDAECALLPPGLTFIEYPADRALAGLSPESRAYADRAFLDRLFEAGRAAFRAEAA
jgi:NTE family protein